MYYNARWYDPALGRFAQADSIVPGGVQGLDRYSYVNNNPMRYTDPSGHDPNHDRCDYYGDCLSAYVKAAITTENGNENRIIKFLRFRDEYDSIGEAQVSDIEMQTPYGEPIRNPQTHEVRKMGLGLRDKNDSCLLGLCTMNQVHDNVSEWAMRRRLQMVYDACTGCTSTDFVMVAALAEDARFFSTDMKMAFSYKSSDSRTKIDWKGYLDKKFPSDSDQTKNKELIQKFTVPPQSVVGN